MVGGVIGIGSLAALTVLGTGSSEAEETATEAEATEETTAATLAGGTLPIPDLVTPTDDGGVQVYELAMAAGTTTIAGGTVSSAGFNGSFLGPTIQLAEGDTVRLEVTNNLTEQATVHWHGVHLPPSADGGPQNIIEAGTTWTPGFTVKQTQACTLWYHPHAIATTARQVSLGLAGMMIVDNGSDANAALPTDYGANDIPLIMQSTAVTSSGQFADTNAEINAGTKHFLVNGTSATAETPTLILAENRVRLRLLNASLVDFIEVVRADGGTMRQVASDAGLLTEPLEVTSLRLVQGERAEIVVDLTADDTVVLRATPKTVANASRATVDMLQITTTGTDTPAALPTTLNTISALDTTGANERTLTLNAGTGGTQTINGVAGTSVSAMEANMLMVNLDDIEVWSVTNATTGTYHSFHLHDVPFQVLSIGDAEPTGADLGWRDTIEVAPRTTVRFAAQFTDYTDDVYMYMLHCHNLIHEDAGMMLGLMITE